MKYLNGNKTSLDICRNAEVAIVQYTSGKVPTIESVVFEHSRLLGCCQQNIRELIEATAFGKERTWSEASCCAGSTAKRLAASDYERVPHSEAQPGDLIYFGGGKECSRCHGEVGHVGVYMGNGNLWQNTSYESRGLCIIPIRQDQAARMIGVYRLFPLAAKPMTNSPVNWCGQYLSAGDVIEQAGQNYISLRALAEAEGYAVHFDPVSHKVFVGPASWWK
ncbi:MAG: NlpC/P60 family protein [Armatimonadota bacterium]